MQQGHLKLAALVAAMLGSASAQALPFNSFDPRSMAMGGAGTAIGDPATAPFFNPALLSASDPGKSYSVELPIIGARLYDPADMKNNLTALSDSVNALNSSISTVNTNAKSTVLADITKVPGNMTTVSNNIDTVNNKLSSLSNKPLQGEFGAATVVGVPGKNYGFAFYADAYGAAGGTLEYNDATTLSNLSADVKKAADVLSGATAVAGNAAAQAACTRVANGTTADPNDVSTCIKYAATLSNLSSTLNNASNTLNFNTNTQVTSKIHVRGVMISEVGASVSHGFIYHDQAWVLGITPKLMQLQLFDALLSANSGNTDGAMGSGNLAKYSAFNFDIGTARNYENGWRTGLVIKNVLPQEYDFKRNDVATGSKLSLKPQIRAGVSHENEWSTVALDADLTKNDPAGLENHSQYVALGGELSALGWAQLRAGYRADLVDSARSLTSVGLGISPRIPYFKFHFDLAYAFNSNEQGASLRFGLNF